MCLWNGIMQIASQTSMIEKITKALRPIMKFLFPDIKETEEVMIEMQEPVKEFPKDEPKKEPVITTTEISEEEGLIVNNNSDVDSNTDYEAMISDFFK